MRFKCLIGLVMIALLASGTDASAVMDQWFARGSFVAAGGAIWDVLPEAELFDDGAHEDGAAFDGVWGRAIPSDQGVGRFEFKVDSGSWIEAYPPDNQLIHILTPGEAVNVTFDTNVYTDGWFPETNIVWSSHSLPEGFVPEVIGNAPIWDDWNSGSPATLSEGIWTVTGPRPASTTSCPATTSPLLSTRAITIGMSSKACWR